MADAHRPGWRRGCAESRLRRHAPKPGADCASRSRQDDDCAEHRPPSGAGGHTALFTTASQLLLDLGAQDSPRALDRRLKYYASVSLLVIDEVGYLSYDSRNADLLFQIVSRRYEEKSLVLTTNLPFSDWATIFPNAACATALIDRIVHHADIIPIEGKSYRRRTAEESKKAKAKK